MTQSNFELREPYGDGFIPRDLPSLRLWLDAKDLSTLWTTSAKATQVAADGDRVGYWADKSGNGFDWSQAQDDDRCFWGDGTTASPKSLNSRPAVHTNDLEASMLDNSSALLASGGDCAIFFAIDSASVTGGSRIMSFDNDSHNINLKGTTDSFWFVTGGSSYGGDTNAGWVLETAILLKTISQSDDVVNTYKNGVAGDLSGEAMTDTFDFAVDGLHGLFGRQSATTSWSNAALGELVFCSPIPELGELNQTGRYLTARWGETWTGIAA